MAFTQWEGRERGKGRLWPSVPLPSLQRACPWTEGREVTTWDESSPSCSGDWTGFKMLRSERYLRSCQVSVRPVKPSLWKSLSWPQKLSSIYLTTLLNALCCPLHLVMKRSYSQVQNVCWNTDTSGFKIHGHAWAAGQSWAALAIPPALCCRERQEKGACCWPRCPTFTPLRCPSDPALTEANRKLVTGPKARPCCIRA